MELGFENRSFNTGRIIWRSTSECKGRFHKRFYALCRSLTPHTELINNLQNLKHIWSLYPQLLFQINKIYTSRL